jgi:hypothetical protein
MSSSGIGHPHQVVAHVYEVEQPSRPIAVISSGENGPFDPCRRPAKEGKATD